MKNIYSFVSVLIIVLINITQLLSNDDPKNWKYFKIDADINSNILFSVIQNELGIKEIESTFVLIVNIQDTIQQNQYIDFIHKNTNAKKRYSWYELSEISQNALLELVTPEKINLNEPGNTNNKYFRISANIKDSPLFSDIQKELLKSDELLETFTLVINISDPNPENNYIVFGNESVNNPVKFKWIDLSAKTRDELLKWKNKENIKIN